jgi:hypothetical protein
VIFRLWRVQLEGCSGVSSIFDGHRLSTGGDHTSLFPVPGWRPRKILLFFLGAAGGSLVLGLLSNFCRRAGPRKKTSAGPVGQLCVSRTGYQTSRRQGGGGGRLQARNRAGAHHRPPPPPPPPPVLPRARGRSSSQARSTSGAGTPQPSTRLCVSPCHHGWDLGWELCMWVCVPWQLASRTHRPWPLGTAFLKGKVFLP